MDDVIARAYKEQRIFPIIDDLRYLEDALANPRLTVLILGDVLNVTNVQQVAKEIKRANRKIVVDLDLISGLSGEDAAIHYLVRVGQVDGIISRQRTAIMQAKKQKVWTVFKAFIQDSISVESALASISQCQPDSLDLLPGAAIPFVLEHFRRATKAPVAISGFMREDPEYIRRVIRHGVAAVNTRNRALWAEDICIE